MKSASSTLKDYLRSQMATPDSVVYYADCFTFTLQTGLVLRYTSADVDITFESNTYLANAVLVSGLKYRSTLGLNTDTQEISISCTPDVKINGVSYMAAIASGLFERCVIERRRVYFYDYVGGNTVGGVLLYTGHVTVVEECGRLSARMSVTDDLSLLEQDMPKNSYLLTCNNVLYDTNCGVNRNSYKTASYVRDGSNPSLLITPDGVAQHVGGYIQFTSGNNAGLQTTIKDVNVGISLLLAYPLSLPVVDGDTFDIYYGCDRLLNTCDTVFANKLRFRGFPYIPPAQFAR
jgi:uncharacterized phage protein (TIGR02218 family)